MEAKEAIAEEMAKIEAASGRHIRHAVMMCVAQDIADALNRAKVGPAKFRKDRLLAAPSLRAMQ